MIIKILGSGCPNCQRLEANTRQAANELGLTDIVFEKVTDYADMARYGILATPALVIDEQVKLFGRIANVKEIKTILQPNDSMVQ